MAIVNFMLPETEYPLEHHPFNPILPPQAKVVMMGTFPPTDEKRCMEFHYPNLKIIFA